MEYRCTFVGRKLGALGVCETVFETVDADSPEEARLKLYENYEHISVLTIAHDEPTEE